MYTKGNLSIQLECALQLQGYSQKAVYSFPVNSLKEDSYPASANGTIRPFCASHSLSAAHLRTSFHFKFVRFGCCNSEIAAMASGNL